MATSNDILPFRSRLFFAFGDWGNTTFYTIFAFFFAFFLNNVAGLPPGYAAWVLLIGGIWDAVNDPLFGNLVDKVHTRWGRRRPFFLFGAVPLALTFIALWWVPPWNNLLSKTIYYTLAYALYDSVATLLVVPYNALTPELTRDYHERTRLNGYRTIVSVGGGLVSAVAAPLLLDQFPVRKTGYLVVAVIFGVLAMFSYFGLFFGVRERYANIVPVKANIFTNLRDIWRNRSFRFVTGIYLTAWVTVAVVSSLFQYYLEDWMHLKGKLDIFLGLVQFSALVCVPIVVWLSGRLGKSRAYAISVGSWAMVMFTLALLTPQKATIGYILAVLVGLGVAAAHVGPWSLIPDAIDAGEASSGQRREGTYYGLLVFIQKCGRSLALAMIQWGLHLAGYVAGAEQPPTALLAIRLLFGPLPAVLLIISLLLAWHYPLERSR
jgi:GPH family glycoside/pentoside/hexuronide:cation symporter